MMTQGEIAWLLMQLLRDTRTYNSVQFASNFCDSTEQIKYAKGLFFALPEYEQHEVEESFDKIYANIIAIRLAARHATHQMPIAVQ